MTVRERTGRKRYVHFNPANLDEMKKLVRLLDGSRIIRYNDVIALRVKHNQLPFLRNIAGEHEIRIDMISGTLKALRRKVSEIQ